MFCSTFSRTLWHLPTAGGRKRCRAANERALEILMPDFMLEQLLEESGGEIRLKEWSRLFKVSQTMLACRLGIPGYFYEEYEEFPIGNLERF